MDHVRCDLCGADEARPELKKDQWRLVRCRSCSLVYLNPRPDPEVIARDYDWFHHAPIQTGARRSEESVFRRLYRQTREMWLERRKPRERAVFERITACVTAGRFLDVGCGDCKTLKAMEEGGFEAHGLDISPTALEHSRTRGLRGVAEGTIHEAPFPSGHFDAVLLMSYLEHEPRPTDALSRVRDLLRPGGFLFLKVPHYDSWNRRFLGINWSGYFFPQHLYYFTPVTMQAFLAKVGFDVIHNGFWDHVPLSDVMWVTARRPLNGTP